MAVTEYVAVFKNGEEKFFKYDCGNRGFDTGASKHACENYFREKKMFSPRDGDTLTEPVDVYLLLIRNGKIERSFAHKLKVNLPLEPYTQELYEREQDALLKYLPEEFRSAVASAAYERGHSCGYGECINILDEMIDWLKPCIADYDKRTKGAK